MKLYRDWCPSHWIEKEARVAQAITKAGIPAPAVGDIVEVDGRGGLIYEPLDGISMLQDLNRRPWTFMGHARSLAELHVKFNRLSIDGLPSRKEGLRYEILTTPDLPDDLRAKSILALDNLPEGDNVCHGDYHPGNVFITQGGPIVIDWMTAGAGTPWADVARTGLLLDIGPRGAGNLVSPFLKMVVGPFLRVYISRYKELIPDTNEELRCWMPVSAAARLNEEIIPERDALIATVREGLSRLGS